MGIPTVLVERAPMERLARQSRGIATHAFQARRCRHAGMGQLLSAAGYDFPIEADESNCLRPPYAQRLELRSTSRPISAPATPPTIVPVARLRPPSIARPTRAPAAAP